MRKPSPRRDTLLRLRANKFRLGTVAIFYGRERQSNRVFNDERILAFIPLSFAQNSFDSSDDSDSLGHVDYILDGPKANLVGAVRFAQNPGVVSESVIRG